MATSKRQTNYLGVSANRRNELWALAEKRVSEIWLPLDYAFPKYCAGWVDVPRRYWDDGEGTRVFSAFGNPRTIWHILFDPDAICDARDGKLVLRKASLPGRSVRTKKELDYASMRYFERSRFFQRVHKDPPNPSRDFDPSDRTYDHPKLFHLPHVKTLFDELLIRARAGEFEFRGSPGHFSAECMRIDPETICTDHYFTRLRGQDRLMEGSVKTRDSLGNEIIYFGVMIARYDDLARPPKERRPGAPSYMDFVLAERDNMVHEGWAEHLNSNAEWAVLLAFWVELNPRFRGRKPLEPKSIYNDL